MNNRVLFFVLIALIGVYFLTKALKGDKTRSFEPMVVRVDSSEVTRIEITRKAEPGVTLTLERNGEGWKVSDGNVTANAPAANVASTLSALSIIEAKRLVARSPEKWTDYEVGEDASRIRVFAGGDVLTDLIIGGFKFDQVNRSASTYVRMADDDAVYLVEGFLAMQLTQGMDSYRNNVVLSALPDNITRIEHMADGQSQVFSRELDGSWLYAGMEAVDSTAMATYLGGIRNLTSRDFTQPKGDLGAPHMSVRITGNNMDPVDVELYNSPDTIKPFIIRSSLNSDAYFASDSSGIYRKVFGELKGLLNEM